MKPIGIVHANVFDDYKEVLVNVELTTSDKEAIEVYHRLVCDKASYNIDDVSMIIFVKVSADEVKVSYIAYFPEEQGECEFPYELMDQANIDACIRFVKDNYLGIESQYDLL